MKKLLAVSLCTVLVLSGCAGGTAQNSKKNLVLSTYGLSEDISAEEVYSPFESKFDCSIVTETGSTNERYTKLSANANSSIDVVELSQAMTAKGIEEGLFEAIDLSKIENSQYLIGPAKTMAESGQGIAYTINSIGIIYDPEAIGFEITDFEDLWDIRLKGKISIPDITTTFGPHIVYMASDYKGADIKADKGVGAFEALTELKPNIVKTYGKSSDLINMFTSGEISVAVVGDFGVPSIVQSNPQLVYITPSQTYANFNTISIPKNSKNKELAYEYINYRLSKELQEKTSKVLNEAPTNNQVVLTEEESENMTYGTDADQAKVLDFSFINPILSDWIDQWNRIINS